LARTRGEVRLGSAFGIHEFLASPSSLNYYLCLFKTIYYETVSNGIVPAALIVGDLKLLPLCAGVVGVVIGAQESIFRANVAKITGTGYLGAAYGVFRLGIGIGYTIAGAIYGALVDSNAGQPFL